MRTGHTREPRFTPLRRRPSLLDRQANRAVHQDGCEDGHPRVSAPPGGSSQGRTECAVSSTTRDPESLDDVLVGEAVLGVYRQMFAGLVRDTGAVVDDPELVDVAEALLSAFAEAGEEGLGHEQLRQVCRTTPPRSSRTGCGC